jgi:hypothetical protein
VSIESTSTAQISFRFRVNGLRFTGMESWALSRLLSSGMTRRRRDVHSFQKRAHRGDQHVAHKIPQHSYGSNNRESAHNNDKYFDVVLRVPFHTRGSVNWDEPSERCVSPHRRSTPRSEELYSKRSQLGTARNIAAGHITRPSQCVAAPRTPCRSTFAYCCQPPPSAL